MKKTVILGVGNILREDEGVGVHIVNELKNSQLARPELCSGTPNSQLIDGGTLGIDLIPYIENADKLIIVDAVKDGGVPGTVYKLQIEDCRLKIEENKLSLHQINLLDTLKIMEIQNKSPKEIVIIGVEPMTLGWGEELSGEVKKKIPEIVNLIHKEIVI